MSAPLEREQFVQNPTEPAAKGWCEALVRATPQLRHCYTYARFDRDGRRICGLHRRALTVTFGPPRP